MLTKKIIKHSLSIFVGSLVFAASSFFLSSCELLEDVDDLDAICENVGLTCSKTPFSYKACADDDGSVWWELNGKKYYNVDAATNAYFAYCGY